MATPITCNNLDEAVEHYTKQLGFRLDMIFPADAPREALVSKDGESLRLVAGPKPQVQSPKSSAVEDLGHSTWDMGRTSGSEWVVGRAGMEYRDILPDRMGGKIIASHIRLTEGGEVPDYVHYHKVDFQMIYCKRGRIRVVYEDQGEPFWLETGDCVLQPPEIRHRVLECTAGAEVIEVTMPAEHETWVEHDMTLPTNTLNPAREFSGQRFVRHIAAENAAQDRRDLGISAATGGKYAAFVEKQPNLSQVSVNQTAECPIQLKIPLNSEEIISLIL
jgi:quercetin dioxygenase-like cupin family protein